MFKVNELIINGRSSEDLPFNLLISENSAPQRTERKDRLEEFPHVTGVHKQTVNAYSPISKEYKGYMWQVTPYDRRLLKAWLGFEGWFTPSDDPDLRYIYERVTVEFEPVDSQGGYEFKILFLCQPFAYEPEQSLLLGSTLTNHTNAPMFPRLLIKGKSKEKTYLQIGQQRMTINRLDEPYTIECQYGHQDAWASGGRKVNHLVRGDFFEIPPGTHRVYRSKEIKEVRMLARWGWM